MGRQDKENNEIPFLVTLVCVAAVVAFVVRRREKWQQRLRKQGCLPPGSSGYPFVGDTISFVKPHPLTSLGDFMKNRTSRFGKVFRSNILGGAVIVSADPELNRFILQSEGRLFRCSYPKSITGILGRWSTITQHGDMHKKLRSVALNFMCKSRLRDWHLPEIERQAVLILESWREGSVVLALNEAKRYSFNVIVKKIMSLSPGDPELESFRKEYGTFAKAMSSAPLNFPGTAYWRAVKARARILKFIAVKIEERLKKTVEGEDDLLSWMFKNSGLSMEQIAEFLLGLIFAGHDTTYVGVALSIYFLGTCPEASEEIRAEHRQLLQCKAERGGDFRLDWEDYKQMNFTRCVISEMLRLGNIVPFIFREALCDVKYKENVIPAGWKVLLVFDAVNLDPSLYENPEKFDPWRWQSIQNDSKENAGSGVKENFMPFGGGPRMCAGYELAKLEISVFLHHLVLNYRWEMAEPDQPLACPGVIFPKGLPIQVHKIS